MTRIGQFGTGPAERGPHPVRLLEHPLQPPQGEYRWVYLWQWPIRAMHWTAAACIVLLLATGFYIGPPYFLPDAQMRGAFFMGWVRLVHFAAAGVLVATGIVRVYWLVAGNRYERFAALFPVRPRDWRNMFRQIKAYLMIHPERAPHYLGHNPLQQILATLTYLAALTMAITGFALYGQSNPGGTIHSLFSWVAPLLGGIPVVRFVHHVLSWWFLIFIPVHVYFAVRADVTERSGVVSSIISGGTFVPADREYIDG
jgi:Ni/Fe-hydrogenase 1 B-type cytochrome subunit